MKIVAKIESRSDLSKLAQILSSLNYQVCVMNNFTIFVFHEKRSSNDLRKDIQAAKRGAGISTTIQYICGSTIGQV